jgi:hypothetical protein
MNKARKIIREELLKEVPDSVAIFDAIESLIYELKDDVGDKFGEIEMAFQKSGERKIPTKFLKAMRTIEKSVDNLIDVLEDI